jgi:hypothetical protein
MRIKLLILTSTSKNYIKYASNEISDYMIKYNKNNIVLDKLSDLLSILEKDKESKLDYSKLDEKIIIYETTPEIDLISLRNVISTSFCVKSTFIKVEPTKYLKYFSDCDHYEIVYPLYANNETKKQNLKLIFRNKDSNL